ncbi:PDDEXK nuclease domain-containing protein [Escherichia coli]
MNIESDFEEALIDHLMDFMLELGDDFAFVGRQRRLRIDDNWFRVDLLFFHRRLRCLLIVDLKVGKFSYSDATAICISTTPKSTGRYRMKIRHRSGSLCKKGAGEAHYALAGLPNTVLASEYKMQLPDEKRLADELVRTQAVLRKAIDAVIFSGFEFCRQCLQNL